jgi:hypothetical protein
MEPPHDTRGIPSIGDAYRDDLAIRIESDHVSAVPGFRTRMIETIASRNSRTTRTGRKHRIIHGRRLRSTIQDRWRRLQGIHVDLSSNEAASEKGTPTTDRTEGATSKTSLSDWPNTSNGFKTRRSPSCADRGRSDYRRPDQVRRKAKCYKKESGETNRNGRSPVIVGRPP